MNQQKEAFFENMAQQGLALTYDDVRLETDYSEYGAHEVDVKSRFSRNIEMPVPMASAAMDTVTTSSMAIAMAKLGGIGVIHAGLSLEAQREEVRRVKLHLNGLIERPIDVGRDQSVAGVLEDCDKRGFDFRTFPVIDADRRLVGLVTQNDFDYCDDNSLPVHEIMTPLSELITAPAETSVNDAYAILKKSKKTTLPLVNEDGTVAGLFVKKDVRRIVEGNPNHYNLDDDGRLRVAAAIPTDEEGLLRVEKMLPYLDVAVLDSAQGDSKYAVAALKALKEAFLELDVVVGNISNGRSAIRLAEAGADGIKVGQGPGSICTTRIETGIGKPQVSAVFECANAVKDMDVPICADGGLRNHGDISIAIVAGAHTVMMGSMLAATKESPGDIIGLEDGSFVKLYRGMGSPGALRDSAASRKRYGVDGSTAQPLAEGVESYVPYKGSVVDLVGLYVAALKKSMSYVGAGTIEDHRQNTQLFRISNAGLRESHPHDVRVITSR